MFFAIFERVQRSQKVGTQRADAVTAIFAGRTRTGQIVDPVDGYVWQTVPDIALKKVEIEFAEAAARLTSVPDSRLS